MLISHSLKDRRIEKDTYLPTGFLLTNRNGGFLNLGISTRYRGLFFPFKGDLLKIIDDIRIPGEITELQNNFWNILRCRNNVYESFFMPFGTNTLVYEIKNNVPVEMLFDVKYAYDNRIWGRNYKLFREDKKIIIEFTKRTDSREDKTHDQKEYSSYIVVECLSDSPQIEILDEWEKQFYDADKERNSHPYERYVYKCLRLKSRHIVISLAETKEQAVLIIKK